MLNFIDAIKGHPTTKIFRVVDSASDRPRDWQLEPIEDDSLEGDEGFYILKAFNILSRENVQDCYIDISLPERINDYVYFIKHGKVRRGYRYEFPGEVISAVPVNRSGNYELFYSKVAPEIGIQVLREGLKVAKT